MAFLAPAHGGPVETVAVTDPKLSGALVAEDGFMGRAALLAQAKAARQAIARHDPDRIVTLGGDCLVALAPFAYLNARHDGKLGVLWIDAHPDVMTAAQNANAHAHVLGMLLGRADAGFAAMVERPLDPTRIMSVGLDRWMPVENEVVSGLGLAHIGSAAAKASSAPVLDWIKANDIEHLAVHFDLDALDPARFRPLLFNKPDLGNACDGVPQGSLLPQDVVRLRHDVGNPALRSDESLGETVRARSAAS